MNDDYPVVVGILTVLALMVLLFIWGYWSDKKGSKYKVK